MSFAQNAGGVGKVRAAHKRKRSREGTTRALKLKGGRTGKTKGKGPKGTGQVRAHQFYPTPPEATQALLDRYGTALGAGVRIWEPATGTGAMEDVLRAGGATVVGTDLYDHGRGGGLAFQLAHWPEGMEAGDAVVTNPPFSEAEAFIRHAVHDLRAGFVAMLLKAAYFHAAERGELFTRFPPSAVHPLMWRLDFTGEGSPAMEMSWYVWDDACPESTSYMCGGTTYEPMARPRAACDDLFSSAVVL